MTDREAMQVALDCMEWHMAAGAYGHDIEGTAGMLRELLSEPVQEQRKPLTDEDFHKLADKHLSCQPESYEVSGVFAFARAVEQAHGIGSKT